MSQPLTGQVPWGSLPNPPGCLWIMLTPLSCAVKTAEAALENPKPAPRIVKYGLSAEASARGAVSILDLMYHSDVYCMSTPCKAPGGCTCPAFPQARKGLSFRTYKWAIKCQLFLSVQPPLISRSFLWRLNWHPCMEKARPGHRRGCLLAPWASQGRHEADACTQLTGTVGRQPRRGSLCPRTGGRAGLLTTPRCPVPHSCPGKVALPG